MVSSGVPGYTGIKQPITRLYFSCPWDSQELLGYTGMGAMTLDDVHVITPVLEACVLAVVLPCFTMFAGGRSGIQAGLLLQFAVAGVQSVLHLLQNCATGA